MTSNPNYDSSRETHRHAVYKPIASDVLLKEDDKPLFHEFSLRSVAKSHAAQFHPDKSREFRRSIAKESVSQAAAEGINPLIGILTGQLTRTPADRRNIQSMLLLGKVLPGVERSKVHEMASVISNGTALYDTLNQFYDTCVQTRISTISSPLDLYQFTRDFSGIDVNPLSPDDQILREDIWRTAFVIRDLADNPEGMRLTEQLHETAESGAFDMFIVQDIMTDHESPEYVKRFRMLMDAVGQNDWQEIVSTHRELLPEDVARYVEKYIDSFTKSIYDMTRSIQMEQRFLIEGMSTSDRVATATQEAVNMWNSYLKKHHGVHTTSSGRSAHKRTRARQTQSPTSDSDTTKEEIQNTFTVHELLYDLNGDQVSDRPLESLIDEHARRNKGLAEALPGCFEYIAHNFGSRSHHATGIKKLNSLSTLETTVWEFKPGEAKGLKVNTRNVRSHRVYFTVDPQTKTIAIVDVVDRAKQRTIERNK